MGATVQDGRGTEGVSMDANDPELYKPRNQETDAFYNREPGLAIVPGSNAAKEYAKFEQFPSKWTAGSQPGNPYVYRPYPRMLYRASEVNGKPLCLAVTPNSREFTDMAEYLRALNDADAFNRECQTTVKNAEEEQKAKENGYRNSPQEAVEYLWNRDRETARGAAERNYADRNMSEPAKREAEKKIQDAGEHLAAIPEEPVKKRRGRPRKNPAA